MFGSLSDANQFLDDMRDLRIPRDVELPTLLPGGFDFLKVTVKDHMTGYSKGRLTYFNPATNAWVDLEDYVLVKLPDGTTPAVSTTPALGYWQGSKEDTTDSVFRGVYVIVRGGGGNTVNVHCDDFDQIVIEY